VSLRRLYLVRHAHAGDRSRWSGDDTQRPLSEKGRGQADRLLHLLAGDPIDRVLSSPSVRCVQTVEPLANARGLKVEIEASLHEGSDPLDALHAVEAVDARSVVACTHGDIVPGILDLLRSSGVAVADDATWPKASTWVLERDGGRFDRVRYLPPP
jgi:broad specificity phosphatase PhoE